MEIYEDFWKRPCKDVGRNISETPLTTWLKVPYKLPCLIGPMHKLVFLKYVLWIITKALIIRHSHDAIRSASDSKFLREFYWRFRGSFSLNNVLKLNFHYNCVYFTETFREITSVFFVFINLKKNRIVIKSLMSPHSHFNFRTKQGPKKAVSNIIRDIAFTDVRTLCGTEMSQFLPWMQQFLDYLWRFFICFNYIEK